MKTGDLVTWEKAKDVLHLDDDQQELVEFLISAASAQAEKIADRFLAARDIVLTLDSSGGREILLPSYPVNYITRVFKNEDELQPNLYSMRAQAGILRFKERIQRGWDAIRFEGNIGYDPVPDDLQQAAIEIVSANLRRFAGSGGSVGIKSMSAQGAITTQYEIDVPLSSRSVFMSYREARV